MQQGKKKLLQTYSMMCAVLDVFILYFFIRYAPIYEPTNPLPSLFRLFEDINNNPFKLDYCDMTIKFVIIALFISIICDLVILSNVKNYRYDEEHGSAKWGTPKNLTKKYAEKSNENNMLITKNVKLSFNDEKTNLNSNVVLVGGPGTGKTYRYIMPNLLNLIKNKCSAVVCDPKGSTLKKTGNILKQNGIKVKVLDLKNPEYSYGYNPFEYIRNDDDIFKMVELIFAANTEKNSSTQDPFFDDNAKFLFLACCYYLKYKAPKEEQNLPFILEMINYLEIKDDDLDYISPFDELFLELQKEEPNNIAVDYYLKFRQAKGRTAMSVVSSLVAKIGKYSLPSIKQMSIYDELKLRELADEPTVLFLLLPDDDKSKNFIASVLYMQLFQQLYDRAEEEIDDRLPKHVQIYMDEFANVPLPDDFDGIIATCRSRNIGISVILQGFSQLKKIYKEAWESITSQCSIFLYMGGMEQSTHEYVSKMLDKETIATNSFGTSHGRNGSYTKNDQQSGRELMTPGEVRLLVKKHSILVVQGELPVLDSQIETSEMEEFKLAKTLGNYDHSKISQNIVKTSVKPVYCKESFDDFGNLEVDLNILAYSTCSNI